MLVDPTNSDSLKCFFARYKGLDNAELATLADCTTETIRRWKKKCGIQAPPNPFKPIQKPQNRDPVTLPENWDTKEWFEEQYAKHGMVKIAKTIDKSVVFVFNRIRKYKIQTKAFEERVKSKNPCKSEDWLYYHYATRDEYLSWCKRTGHNPCANGGMGLSLADCAALAGVVPGTIVNWLVHFHMRIRTIGEAQSGSRNHQRNREWDAQAKRKARETFFANYRCGKVAIAFGKALFRNGRRVDTTEVKRSGSSAKATSSS